MTQRFNFFSKKVCWHFKKPIYFLNSARFRFGSKCQASKLNNLTLVSFSPKLTDCLQSYSFSIGTGAFLNVFFVGLLHLANCIFLIFPWMNQNWVQESILAWLNPFLSSILEKTRFKSITIGSWVKFANH